MAEGKKQIGSAEWRLREIQRIARIGIWERSLIDNTVVWCDELCRIFGVEPGGQVRHHSDWLKRVHPEDQAEIRNAVAHASETGRFEVRYRLIRPDGTLRWIRSVGTILTENQTATRMFGISQDVTDEALAQEKLQDLNARLTAVIEGTTDYVSIKDREGRYLLINSAGSRSMGLRVEEFLGKTDFDVYPPETASEVHKIDQDAMNSGETRSYERTLFFPYGMRTYHFVKAPYRDSKGGIIGVAGVSRDISARKQAEIELRKSKEDLARSNADLEQFAYLASHDLKEPLRVVAGYVHLLVRHQQAKSDPRTQEYLAYISDAVSRMEHLIRDLLRYARLGREEVALERTDLNETLQQVEQDLKASIEESGARITIERLPVVDAHSSEMRQLFENLVANAIKFHSDACPRIEVSARRMQDEWVFSVTDNGIGIDPRYQEKIFGIFQRLNSVRRYPGTGLGLALARRIVERHQGRIWVESSPGAGASFKFTLPVRRKGAKAA